MRTLATLQPGESAVIAGFTVDNGATERLMQLGLLDGSEVELVRRAPAGDPLEVKVMGYALSLRAADADLILLESV